METFSDRGTFEATVPFHSVSVHKSSHQAFGATVITFDILMSFVLPLFEVSENMTDCPLLGKATFGRG